MIECQPEASGVMKEKQRKNHRKGHPQGELLIDRHAGERVEEKVSRHGYADGGAVVDVHSADKVALLTLESQIAIRAMIVHFERLRI